MDLVSPTSILRMKNQQQKEIDALRERINNRLIRIPTPWERYYLKKIQKRINILQKLFRRSIERLLG